MASIPFDLLPLPTRPYDERPSSLPLDVEECRTALFLNRGNITTAAELIKVAPQRLRNFVARSPRLMAVQREFREQLADRGEAIVHEAMEDQVDAGRRDSMAKYILNSQIGRARGFGAVQPSVKINNIGPIVIGWANEPGFELAPALEELEADDA